MDFIVSTLGIQSKDAMISYEEPIITDTPVQSDILIQDPKWTYVIEVKKRVSIESFSYTALQKALIEKETSKKNYRFIIAATVIPQEIQLLAEKINVELVQLPHNLTIPQITDQYATKGKITAEKSWRVICRLLKEKRTSIRQLAVKEHVSYGLAHKVIQELLDSDIAIKNVNLIQIQDISPLFNVIAWERNTRKLQISEFWPPHQDFHSAAQELSDVGMKHGFELVCNSFTAAGLYTGYAMKHDEIHFYIDKEYIPFLLNTYTDKTGRIKAIVYLPDRDVSKSSKLIEGIRVTSPGQTLLDIAGMGYSGINLAKKMVEIFDRL
ncbi:hypothetical protein [Methanospirillum hungatei]|uniref:hypothetical protein n=1 Tax=Methanospirillum hungatei TaxID=2203 RepID=UPI0026EC72DF|nr:hypothetical protein [Methanospirillum hungatei]